MALAIATNTAALNAAASASSVNRDMETSMARLSTGKRINSASDDAAGVAISSRLSAEIRGTDQAIRNSLDGQALIDTAEGAHKEVENILQRMREVSVQAANDTNNSQDRANLQSEMDAMVTEIDRIASTTTWAGENLMKSSTGSNFSFQVGSATGVENQINVTIDGMGAKNLGISASSAVDVASANAAQATFDGLVNAKAAAAATVATAVSAQAAANTKVANLELYKTADAALTAASTAEEHAGALRDVMVGGASLSTPASIVSTTASKGLGYDTLLSEFKVHLNEITDQGEKDKATFAVSNFENAIDTFEATTTNADAKTAYEAIVVAYDAVLAVDTSVTDVGAGGLKDTFGLVAGNAASIASGAGAATTITTLLTTTGDGDAKVVAPGDLDTQIADAKAAATSANNDVLIAEGNLNTATIAVNDGTDPANLTGTNLSVGTGDSARASITTIDTAIKTVNIQRSELGAVSNRLNHTVNNLTNISSNLSAAKGGIEDADFALETTNLAKNQILQQASTAMLAQANASKQNVLSLLQG
jgi:flagellin